MSEVKQIQITIQRPLSENDPGVCARGHYSFEDGIVHLTDENGTPLKRGLGQMLTSRSVKGARDAPVWSAAALAEQTPRAVAGRLLHQKYSAERSHSDFNRPLIYSRHGIA